MKRLHPLAVIAALALPGLAAAQDAPGVSIELNTVDTVDQACRLTFVLNNTLEADIDKIVAETVLFSDAGSVLLLTLFDFGDLPAGRPRVRQFQVPDTSCEQLGQVLVNGLSTCNIAGAQSDQCAANLSLSSRLDVELKG